VTWQESDAPEAFALLRTYHFPSFVNRLSIHFHEDGPLFGSEMEAQHDQLLSPLLRD